MNIIQAIPVRRAAAARMRLRWLACIGALAVSGLAIAQSASSAAAGRTAASASPYRPAPLAGRAGHYYKLLWGIDELQVKWTESGEVVRFSWRVLDPRLAATLNAKELEPSLVDPQAGVSLVIPQLENIGMLRQTATPLAGHSYWMAFSNKGRMVRKGDRVNVVIGPFRADGLVVE
jgi:hypothetical protein